MAGACRIFQSALYRVGNAAQSIHYTAARAPLYARKCSVHMIEGQIVYLNQQCTTLYNVMGWYGSVSVSQPWFGSSLPNTMHTVDDDKSFNLSINVGMIYCIIASLEQSLLTSKTLINYKCIGFDHLWPHSSS